MNISSIPGYTQILIEEGPGEEHQRAWIRLAKARQMMATAGIGGFFLGVVIVVGIYWLIL